MSNSEDLGLYQKKHFANTSRSALCLFSETNKSPVKLA
ncbi:MAG: hypothetical protein ACI956_000750, partial [Nonlabens sp.]